MCLIEQWVRPLNRPIQTSMLTTYLHSHLFNNIKCFQFIRFYLVFYALGATHL